MDKLNIYDINILQFIILNKLINLVDCYSDNSDDVLPLLNLLEKLQNVKKELC